jgi:hypothetical protein
MMNFIQDSWTPSRESNPGRPEYKAVAPVTLPIFLLRGDRSCVKLRS